MDELELRQLFKNMSDCYADTWEDGVEQPVEGEVIQAMTEDRFIEVIKEIEILNSNQREKIDGALTKIYNQEHIFADHPLVLADT